MGVEIQENVNKRNLGEKKVIGKNSCGAQYIIKTTLVYGSRSRIMMDLFLYDAASSSTRSDAF